jgi:tRNA C32,U32 (ribose-2'-O)-methylase TrmJ
VLVSPKRPISVGTVARSLACFECEDLRIVEPRCDHLARSSRNGSKGAQFLLWRAQRHDTLQQALADADFSVACTRWVAGRALHPPPSLTLPVLARLHDCNTLSAQLRSPMPHTLLAMLSLACRAPQRLPQRFRAAICTPNRSIVGD